MVAELSMDATVEPNPDDLRPVHLVITHFSSGWRMSSLRRSRSPSTEPRPWRPRRRQSPPSDDTSSPQLIATLGAQPSGATDAWLCVTCPAEVTALQACARPRLPACWLAPGRGQRVRRRDFCVQDGHGSPERTQLTLHKRRESGTVIAIELL